MSTPIRPPTGPQPSGVAGLDGAAAAGDVEGSDRVGSAGAPGTQAIERGGSVDRASSAETQGATASVLSRLEAGELTREQAVESLVQEALDAYAGGSTLAPAQRAELAGVLRVALLDDPTLSRLLEH